MSVDTPKAVAHDALLDSARPASIWVSLRDELRLDLLASSCYIFCLKVTGVKIHLPSYPRGIHKIHETLSAADLDLDAEVFSAPIDVQVRLDRHDPYLELDLQVRTEVSSQCDRCLIDYQWMLAAETPMLYVLGRLPSGDSVDDPGIGYLPANSTDLDLTGDIRDQLILSLPEKYLHQEDCLGLCPGCGADLNTQECTCGLSRDVSRSEQN